MFPDTQHSPPQFPQFLSASGVAGDVALEFLIPVRGMACGPSVASWTAVPEAAVEKYGEPRARKNEIGLSRKRDVPAPSGDVRLAQKLNEPLFRGLVSAGADSRHIPGTLFWSQHVSGHCF
jgi:hypothetical protein